MRGDVGTKEAWPTVGGIILRLSVTYQFDMLPVVVSQAVSYGK